ncbi:MFS transporter, partial [Bacillus cereus group sp. TH230-1LC]|nr:MFS transporter [Bacillus cereus group sp. TH230-1LC]
NKTQAFISGSISLLFYIAVVFAMGKYSDRIGRKKMLLWASLSFIALTIPLFYLLSTASFVEMVMIQLVFCTLLAMNDGSLPVYLTEQFPIQVRYTGFAFSFNTANALLGGTVPFVATWLIQQTGNTLAPSVLLIVVAIFASMALLQKKSHRLVSAKA